MTGRNARHRRAPLAHALPEPLALEAVALGLELGEAHRYRVRTLPAAGAILRADDSAEQLTL